MTGVPGEGRGGGPAPAGASADERIPAAERLLAEHGLAGARVRAAGPELEIAAVAAPPAAFPLLVELAPALRALGFRYVALELE